MFKDSRSSRRRLLYQLSGKLEVPLLAVSKHQIQASLGKGVVWVFFGFGTGQRPPGTPRRRGGGGDEIMSAEAHSPLEGEPSVTSWKSLLLPASSARTVSVFPVWLPLQIARVLSPSFPRLAPCSLLMIGFLPRGPGVCLDTGARGLNCVVSPSHLILQITLI